jgi:hypothetical protein
MKTAFSAAFILTLVASTAHGSALQVETRAFHSNLHLALKQAIYTVDGQQIGTDGASESFRNAAGGGVAFVGTLDEYVSLGVGYERVRYFPAPETTTDQQSLSMFTRFNLYQGDISQLYFLAGLTEHRLTAEAEVVDVKYSPVMNYDFGLGHNWNFGMWTVGLAYKYSDTFGRGNNRTVIRSRVYNELQLVETEVKTRVKNFNIEQQQLSLSLGVNI